MIDDDDDDDDDGDDDDGAAAAFRKLTKNDASDTMCGCTVPIHIIVMPSVRLMKQVKCVFQIGQ